MSEETLIEQANKAAERLEKANKATEELVKRQEAMEARRVLGGQSDAGNKPPEPSQEEKLKAGMKKYFAGSALEPFIK
jgi:hypothetical protein